MTFNRDTRPTQSCPFCGEQIMADAKKCRFCGEWLTEPPAQASAQGAYTPPPYPPQFDQGAAPRSGTRQAWADAANRAPRAAYQPPDFDFFTAVGRGWARWNQFEGRATRSEYWFFYLFCTVVSIVLSLLQETDARVAGLLSLLFTLAAFVPMTAALTRRLHDTNRSGWNQLWVLTIIGAIPLIIWACTASDPHRNEYGDPVE